MLQIVHFLIIATVVCCGEAKVQLKKGINLTVAFEGAALTIEVENPQNQHGYAELCFGSSADVTSKFCPRGYAPSLIALTANKKTLTLNRLGKLLPEGQLSHRVHFEDDGTLRVFLAETPSGVLVTLPNAEISVVTTTTTTTLAPNNGTSHKAIVLILFVTILIIVLVTVGITVCYFCFCRRNKRQTVAVPEEQLPSKLNRTNHRVDNQKTGARKPSSAITTTRTTTSTTKVPAKNQRVDSAPKPTPSAPIANRIDCVSIRPATTQESISDSRIL